MSGSRWLESVAVMISYPHTRTGLTASRVVPDFSPSQMDLDVATAGTVPWSREQPGAFGGGP